MKSTLKYCPRCEKRINYQLRSDGSCKHCNEDLSHTEPPVLETKSGDNGSCK